MMFDHLTLYCCVNLPINIPFIIVPIFLLLRAPWVINVLSWGGGEISVFQANHCTQFGFGCNQRGGCYLLICKGGEELLKLVGAVSLGETDDFVDFSSHDSPALRKNESEK